MYRETMVLWAISLLFLSYVYPIYAYPIYNPCLRDESHKCIKWVHRDLSYKVINIINGTTDYTEYAEDALHIWQYYTGGLFTFKKSNAPDIWIRIVDSAVSYCGNDVLGCTNIHTDKHGTIQYAYVIIAKKDCVADKISICFEVRDSNIFLAMEHEIGHVLGLDHSIDDRTKPVSIMYFQLNDGMQITKADIDAVKDLYK